jgi:hypothetical protein
VLLVQTASVNYLDQMTFLSDHPRPHTIMEILFQEKDMLMRRPVLTFPSMVILQSSVSLEQILNPGLILIREALDTTLYIKKRSWTVGTIDDWYINVNAGVENECITMQLEVASLGNHGTQR